jgi:hypothetical protein
MFNINEYADRSDPFPPRLAAHLATSFMFGYVQM